MDLDKFGRYRKLELIGQGGMGRVYKAYDPVMERDVAIKFLAVHQAEKPGFRSGFAARPSLRPLRPHVLPIYDKNGIDDQLYLVMPFIDGIDLISRSSATVPCARRKPLG